MNKHQKLPETHRAAILRVIERILNYQQQQGQTNEEIPFDNETFQLLTRVAANELTMPKVSVLIVRREVHLFSTFISGNRSCLATSRF